MPITFTIDDAPARVRATASGVITRADVLDHVDDQASAGALPLPELVDARSATAPLTGVDVRAIVDGLRRTASTSALGPVAIVVSDDVTYGMLRMLEMLIGDVCRVRPFRDAAEASRWLAAPDA